MKPSYHYTTVLEALEDVKEKSFTYDFNIHQEDIKTNPHNYEVNHVYRYEGDTDPAEESVLSNYGVHPSSGLAGPLQPFHSRCCSGFVPLGQTPVFC